MPEQGEIETVIAALEAASVDYIIVGGVAVVLHGYLRVTGDLDLVVRLTAENGRAAIEALAALGYEPRAPVPALWFADARKRAQWRETKNMMVFSLWSSQSDLEVDLFTHEPFDYDTVRARARRVGIGLTDATVIALDDLIELKRSAGRAQDLADVEALEALQAGDA